MYISLHSQVSLSSIYILCPMLHLKIKTKNIEKLNSQFHHGIFFRYLIMTLFIETKPISFTDTLIY